MFKLSLTSYVHGTAEISMSQQNMTKDTSVPELGWIIGSIYLFHIESNLSNKEKKLKLFLSLIIIFTERLTSLGVSCNPYVLVREFLQCDRYGNQQNSA